MENNTFDYVKFDEIALDRQSNAKAICVNLEVFIQSSCEDSRSKALAFTKLEECYMWIGKAIRDDQIIRTFQQIYKDKIQVPNE